MPKIRNCDVKGDPGNVCPGNTNNNVKIFGENVTTTESQRRTSITSASSSTLTPVSDVDSISLELNKLGGFSSSSSQSWSDEYDSDVAKRIQEELELVDAALRGDIDIPPHYDKDELELWKTTFPKLRIFETDLTPVNSTEDLLELVKKIHSQVESLKVTGYKSNTYPKKGCDKQNSTKRVHTPTVINLHSEKLNEMCVDRNQKQYDGHHRAARTSFIYSSKPKSLDKCLKVLPIWQSSSCKSSRSTREMGNQPLECKSLPFIQVTNSPVSSASSRRRKQTITVTNTNRLVLPPINYQFRSISALPNEKSKPCSALSMDKILAANKKRLLDDFLEDSVSAVKIYHVK